MHVTESVSNYGCSEGRYSDFFAVFLSIHLFHFLKHRQQVADLLMHVNAYLLLIGSKHVEYMLKYVN